MKHSPFCAEDIQHAAVFCKHVRNALLSGSASWSPCFIVASFCWLYSGARSRRRLNPPPHPHRFRPPRPAGPSR